MFQQTLWIGGTCEESEEQKVVPKGATRDRALIRSVPSSVALPSRPGLVPDFIRPGKPVENSYIESFNRRLRDECLNVEVFFTLADVRDKLEAGARITTRCGHIVHWLTTRLRHSRHDGQRPQRSVRNQIRTG